MSPKQRVQQFVDRIPDSATLDEVLGKLELFTAIEVGSAQCDRGECMDHDEFFAELLVEVECVDVEIPAHSMRR